MACAAKRKALDVAPRDEEQRERHVAASLRGRGGVGASKIWINQDEGANIMRETAMALKNSKRRVRTPTIDSNDGKMFSFTSECSAHNIPGTRHRDLPFLVKESWRRATTGSAIRAA